MRGRIATAAGRNLDFGPPRAYKRAVAAEPRPALASRALVVPRWSAAHALGRPGTWLLLAATGALVALGRRLSPLGDVGVDAAWELADAWAVPVAIVGTALTLALFERGEAFLRLLPAGPRLLGEGTALALGALGLQIPLLASAWAGSGHGPGIGVLGWLLADLHAAALGLLLLRWPALAGARAGLFVALVWLVPTLLSGGGGRLVSVILDLERARVGATASPATFASGLAVLAALLLAGHALAHPLPRASGGAR